LGIKLPALAAPSGLLLVKAGCLQGGVVCPEVSRSFISGQEVPLFRIINITGNNIGLKRLLKRRRFEFCKKTRVSELPS
jgi:hypothetical protein